MGYEFTTANVRFLRSSAGQDACGRFSHLELTDSSLLADLTAVRKFSAEHGSAVAETIRLRRKSVAKLGPDSAAWLMTDESLQQASPQPVARHRARRLAGLGVHDVTCSIGADLVELGRTTSTAVGSDLDPIRLLMAQHNLVISGVPSHLIAADALRPASKSLLPYADPARRDKAGSRILSVETLPPVSGLDAVWAHRPPVLRLPPGINYDLLARPGEVEIVSLDGSAREAVLWPTELATVARRATVLDSTGTGYELTTDDPDDSAVAAVGAWIVDPDPAVVRAHLVRHFAVRHGLWQLDPHLAYLTGDAPPPMGRAFQVLDAAPFSEKQVGRWLVEAGAGTVEIKVRGVAAEPDAIRIRLRKSLRGPKSVSRTIILARVGRQAMAYLAIAVAA